MEKLYVTREGLEKLKDDLAASKARRIVVADAIELARSYGDLSENAEYHAAKEEQAILHARIRDLEDKIARASLLENENIDTSKVYLGANVKALNKKRNREMCYQVVSAAEADLASGKISVKSPIGQALMGCAVGDTVVAKVPAGDIELEILEITR